MNFSVTIPTLQRSSLLPTLLQRLADEPLVREIIVVNNAAEPLPFTHAKVIALDQEDNIFVNPAWNLGAATASGKYLCISNDDVLFDPRIFRFARRVLRLPVGILAPAPSCYEGLASDIPDDQPPSPGRLRLLPVYRRTFGFGSLMFMKRSSYRPIPETMRIWYGDDYLFEHQEHRNMILSGFPIETPMSVTVGSGAFDSLIEEDRTAFITAHRGTYHERFQREARVLSTVLRGARRFRRAGRTLR